MPHIRLLARGLLWAVTGMAGSAAQVMRAPGYYLPPAKPTPPPGAASTSAHALSNSNLLDLNAATAEQLRALPGMGAEYARRVIAGRPYGAKNQLVTHGVLPAAEYARIRELVVAHRAMAAAASPAPHAEKPPRSATP